MSGMNVGAASVSPRDHAETGPRSIEIARSVATTNGGCDVKIAKNGIAATLVALCGAVGVHPVFAEDYDLIILNGRVMDSGSPPSPTRPK
jgi:hypothetical protein